MSRAVRAETRSRAKEDIKRVICAIDRVRKWEKKWVSIGEATMKVYKWVPVANQESRTLISNRKTLFPRRENFSMLKKLSVPGISATSNVGSNNPQPPNEDSNISQDSSNQDSQDNQINMKPANEYSCELSTDAPEGHMTTSSQSEEEHRLRNKNIDWALHQNDNAIYVDESTRASQGSNYGEEEDEEDEVAMPTQDVDKASISFEHQLSSNNIPDPADGDSDIRLAMSIVGRDEENSKEASAS